MASATIDADPVTMAAAVLAPAISAFAANASTTVVVLSSADASVSVLTILRLGG
ncbi:hypothetical protein ACETU7_29590 [Rhodococcus sp. 3Y1]